MADRQITRFLNTIQVRPSGSFRRGLRLREPATAFHPEAIAAAMGVLDRHLEALNSGDAFALAQTLHFPHYRLAGGRMKIWERSETYLQDFYVRG
jgi:hypothetical protein